MTHDFRQTLKNLLHDYHDYHTEANKKVEDLQLITASEIIDKLITIQVKLFLVLDQAAELDRKRQNDTLTDEDIAKIIHLSGENIRLVKQRSFLKSSFDKKLNQAIKNGETNILDEVKNYGTDK